MSDSSWTGSVVIWSRVIVATLLVRQSSTIGRFADTTTSFISIAVSASVTSCVVVRSAGIARFWIVVGL